MGKAVKCGGAAGKYGERCDEETLLREYCSICHRSALSSLHIRVLALCLQRWQLGYAVKVSCAIFRLVF